MYIPRDYTNQTTGEDLVQGQYLTSTHDVSCHIITNVRVESLYSSSV